MEYRITTYNLHDIANTKVKIQLKIYMNRKSKTSNVNANESN